jgi:hypothetical protein
LAGSWFVVSGDKALIFGQDADRKWLKQWTNEKFRCEAQRAQAPG